MKKLLLPLSLGVLVAGAASAQSITLSQASFASASMSGADTLLTTATAPTYPALTADAGANLDFTGATSASNTSVLYRVAGTGGNQWADSVALNFSIFGYKANLESSLSASAYTQGGEHIDRVAYAVPTDPITTDSLVINNQDIVFSAPRTRIAFPATNQSKWSSTYQYDFSFNLTLTPLSINNAAGIVRAYITEKDTVIGYGKVRVKDANGNPSAYMDVLQIEAITTTTDSFFLNGAAASPTLLSLFSLNQGETIVAKDQYYFRAGELTPLVHLSYDSTNTPTTAETQASRVVPSFIPETKYTSTLNVYPNPVTSHVIMVSGAPANYGNWNYELESVTGQVVTKGALQLSNNQGSTSIALSNEIVPGTYFLHMYNNDATQEAVRTLTIK